MELLNLQQVFDLSPDHPLYCFHDDSGASPADFLERIGRYDSDTMAESLLRFEELARYGSFDIPERGYEDEDGLLHICMSGGQQIYAYEAIRPLVTCLDASESEQSACSCLDSTEHLEEGQCLICVTAQMPITKREGSPSIHDLRKRVGSTEIAMKMTQFFGYDDVQARFVTRKRQIIIARETGWGPKRGPMLPKLVLPDEFYEQEDVSVARWAKNPNPPLVLVGRDSRGSERRVRLARTKKLESGPRHANNDRLKRF